MGLVNKIATKVATKTSGKSDVISELLKAKAASKEKAPLPDTSTKYEKTEILPDNKSYNNFQKKFKETKVVDENKKPAVMYHGRTKDFDKFDTSGNSSPAREIGVHLGSPEQANTFASKEGGNVVPTYVDVKNPLRLHDYGSFTADDVLEQLRSEGFNQSVIDSIDDLPFEKKSTAVIDLIKSKGYDGIVYLNRREGLNIKGSDDNVMSQLDEIADYDDKTLREEYGAKDSYVIFDPAQAKSVFNKGTYSETDDRFNYNKGGDVNAEMNKLFAEGGVMQQGGTVDPVSGNDVPPGAMAEEVRDDIPAQLSEGEFVMPADVVRYWGLEKLMAMRDKAKMGLKKMEEIGQMGNAEEVPDGEALHGGEDEMDEEAFSSEIDSILGEEGGEEERGYAEGGYVNPESEKLYKDAPLKGFEMVPMTNAAGDIIYIPHVNGEPQLNVPTGYSAKKSPIQNAPTAPSVSGGITTGGVGSTSGLLESGGTGGDGSTTGGDGVSGPASAGISMTPEGVAVANTVSTTAASIAGMVASAVTGIPGLSVIGKTVANAMNFNAAQQAMNVNVAVADTTNPANEAPTDAPTATAGPAGTGGSAAAAASAAASAAAATGVSDAAIGAASQAAATATVNGASPAEAAAIGAAAAVSAAVGEANAAAAESAPSVSAPEGGTVGPGGVAPGGGEAPSVGDSAPGDAPGAAPGESGVSATGESAAGGPASGGGSDGTGTSGDSSSDGGASGASFAKGGFMSKPIKSAKQKGLASRRK